MTKEEYEKTLDAHGGVYSVPIEGFEKLWEDYQKLVKGIKEHHMAFYFETNKDRIDTEDAKLYKLIEE